MANDFLCPFCRGHLTVNEVVVLSIKSGQQEKGLILLSPEIGNYTNHTHSSFKIEQGVEYVLYCPICGSTLNTKQHHRLCRLIMIGEDYKEYDVFFSGMGGEYCTYKVRDKKVEMKGPHAELYEKYLDVPPEDKKYL